MSKKSPITQRAPKSERALASLRAKVRKIIIEEGAAVAPEAQTSEAINSLIAGLTKPGLERKNESIVDRLTIAGGDDIAREVSDNHGAIMCAYGDAGYYVGVAVGLELAALAFGARPKGGR